MKKTYQSPKADYMTISLEQMIADSGYGDPENGVSLNEVVTTNATSGNLSRRNIWDDEDVAEEDF